MHSSSHISELEGFVFAAAIYDILEMENNNI